MNKQRTEFDSFDEVLKVPRSRRKPKINEQQVKADVLAYCQKAGIWVQRRNVAGIRKLHGHFMRLGTKGQSDLWGIHKGRHWECELKRPGEEPRDDQEEWMQECRDHGAYCFWADSLDMFIEKWGSLRSQCKECINISQRK